ncbi:Transglycosylase SLT domain-containing protein [Cribrihabitans marinus]|uniref:Transglycosylase SLT domain-containing protein n=2 Tax=Cribrihabitans marinus TaxID=1227549 RepID=A0A1H6VK44_9RHOB|nr:lytic transglycosylase [Cribrihabitans marinus]SEJ00595.1 Transglycosylase SLT domain-containing protein [Cribrihabitans marinus]
MTLFTRRSAILGLAAMTALPACGASVTRTSTRNEPYDPPLYPNETPELRASINKWADHYELPRQLVHRLAIRESTHRPWAVARPYYGLLQILPATARSMGYRGAPQGLLDADTNLKYAGKYLRGAWLLSDGSMDRAIQHYARGYYYEAKRRGMLVETGLRPAPAQTQPT